MKKIDSEIWSRSANTYNVTLAAIVKRMRTLLSQSLLSLILL